MARRTRQLRGPIIAFAMAVVLGVVSYALSPAHSYGAGGYPGPDALPGVPTYGSYLGNIPVGGHSPISYVCGLDAPNKTNNSPKAAVAEINGQIAAYLPISTQFGCAQFVVFVRLSDGIHTAPCGYAYVSVNGGRWILVHDGKNFLLITGIKHYRHVGAYFPFFIPTPAIDAQRCGTTTTTIPATTIPGTTTPNTNPPTTIHGQTTTTAIPGTSTTNPNYHTTTSNYRPGTSTIPYPPNHSPGGVIQVITQIGVLIAIAVGIGAAGAGLGQFLVEIPEALVEEYTTEIAPGGGLPSDRLPSGGAGTLTEAEAEEAAAIVAAMDEDIPPGGGLPFGGLVPEGTVSEENLIAAILEEDAEDVVLIALDDPDVLPGGGYPVSGVWIRSGGLVIEVIEDSDSGGGEA